MIFDLQFFESIIMMTIILYIAHGIGLIKVENDTRQTELPQ